jgi:hypothetical protein
VCVCVGGGCKKRKSGISRHWMVATVLAVVGTTAKVMYCRLLMSGRQTPTHQHDANLNRQS